MPRKFDTTELLNHAGTTWNVKRHANELDESYRQRIARACTDQIEAVEIWTGRGWNEWTDADKRLISHGLPTP